MIFESQIAELWKLAPVTPYAGTSGWSGTATSEERAVREDGDGTTSYRQQETMGTLFDAGYFGVTWKELGDLYGWHHGQASGVLSVLHKAGKIIRLKDRRNKSSIYVLPNYVNNREISERKVKTCENCGHEL